MNFKWFFFSPDLPLSVSLRKVNFSRFLFLFLVVLSSNKMCLHTYAKGEKQLSNLHICLTVSFVATETSRTTQVKLLYQLSKDILCLFLVSCLLLSNMNANISRWFMTGGRVWDLHAIEYYLRMNSSHYVCSKWTNFSPSLRCRCYRSQSTLP